MESVKTWLKEIVDETENMDKQSYDNWIEYFKEKGIALPFIRKSLSREQPQSDEALREYFESITIALDQYYERWKKNQKDKEDSEKAFKPYPVEEPGGVSLKTKIAVVLYELKEKDLEQFNWFCTTFL
jgi:hypothetical protein